MDIKVGLRFVVRDYEWGTVYTISEIVGIDVHILWSDMSYGLTYQHNDVINYFSAGTWIVVDYIKPRMGISKHRL